MKKNHCHEIRLGRKIAGYELYLVSVHNMSFAFIYVHLTFH